MPPVRLLPALALALALAAPVAAQVSVIACNVPPVQFGAVDAADYDGDGHLDLLVTGLDEAGEPVHRVLRYVRRNVAQIPMGGVQSAAVYAAVSFVNRPVYRGAARWGDVDGDGDPDFIITGLAREDVTTDSTREVPATTVYRNDGTTFLPAAGLALPPVFDSAVAWGDYDGDGDLDLALAGDTGAGRLARVYRNDGGAFADAGAALPGLAPADLDWGDYDGDGDLDLVVTGLSDDERPLTRIFRNDDGAFTDLDAPLPALFFGRARWGDYDGDGDLDLLLTGGRLAPDLLLGTTRVYRNDGGTFADAGLDLEGVLYGDAAWADVDADGDPDLLLMGLRNLGDLDREVTRLYRNDGGALVPAYRLRGTHFGDALLYDYDGNGLPDVLYTGLQINVAGGQRTGRLVVNLWEAAPPVVDPESIVSLAEACN